MAVNPDHMTRKLVSLPNELLRAIEDFRFQHRIKTEAEAIRRLIEAGLNTGDNSASASPSGLGPSRKPDATAEPPAKSRARTARARPLAMSKEAQIRALRARDAG
jgi:hypothetical protein